MQETDGSHSTNMSTPAAIVADPAAPLPRLRLPASLRSLTVACSEPMMDMLGAALRDGHLAGLCSLDMDLFDSNAHGSLGRLFPPAAAPRPASPPALPALTALDIHRAYEDLPDDFFARIAAAAPNLRRLRIQAKTLNAAATDATLPAGLEELSVTLRGEGVASLVRAAGLLPSLRLLDVHCDYGGEALQRVNDLTLDALIGILRGGPSTPPPLRHLSFVDHIRGSSFGFERTLSLVRACASLSRSLETLVLRTRPLHTPEAEESRERGRRLGKELAASCPRLGTLSAFHCSPSVDGMHASVGLDAFIAGMLDSLREHRHLRRFVLPYTFPRLPTTGLLLPFATDALAAMRRFRRDEARHRPAWDVVARGLLLAKERRVRGGAAAVPMAATLADRIPARALREIGEFLPADWLEIDESFVAGLYG
jgi:hypothetical protein